MVRPEFRRKLAVLAVSLTLLAPWPAQALPLDRPLGESLSGAAARLTEWLAILFGDVGCSLDPGGVCRNTGTSQPVAPTDQVDVGCSLDPSGGCRD